MRTDVTSVVEDVSMLYAADPSVPCFTEVCVDVTRRYQAGERAAKRLELIAREILPFHYSHLLLLLLVSPLLCAKYRLLLLRAARHRSFEGVRGHSASPRLLD